MPGRRHQNLGHDPGPALKIDQQSNTHQCRAIAFAGRRSSPGRPDQHPPPPRRRGSALEMLAIFAHPSAGRRREEGADPERQPARRRQLRSRSASGQPLDDERPPGFVLCCAYGPRAAGRWGGDSARQLLAASALELGIAPLSTGAARQKRAPRAWRAIGSTALRGHSGNVIGVAFSTIKPWHRGGTIPSSSGTSRPRQERAGLEREQFASRGNVNIRFSPDGGLLAIGEANGFALYGRPAAGPSASADLAQSPV